MIIKICDKCKSISTKTLIPKLKQLSPDVEIKVGCQNMCGVGRTKQFAIINNKALTAQTEEELIDKIKEEMNNQ